MTLEVLGGKWKALLVWLLHEHGSLRYTKFTELVPAITQKKLTQQLRELEKYGVVSREVHPSVPPAVEYSLTELGQQLTPILTAMDEWGARIVAQYQAPDAHENDTNAR